MYSWNSGILCQDTFLRIATIPASTIVADALVVFSLCASSVAAYCHHPPSPTATSPTKLSTASLPTPGPQARNKSPPPPPFGSTPTVPTCTAEMRSPHPSSESVLLIRPYNVARSRKKQIPGIAPADAHSAIEFHSTVAFTQPPLPPFPFTLLPFKTAYTY